MTLLPVPLGPPDVAMGTVVVPPGPLTLIVKLPVPPVEFLIRVSLPVVARGVQVTV